jgi:hypothetical protein
MAADFLCTVYEVLLTEFCLQVEQKEMDADKPEDVQVPA